MEPPVASGTRVLVYVGVGFFVRLKMYSSSKRFAALFTFKHHYFMLFHVICVVIKWKKALTVRTEELVLVPMLFSVVA